MIINVSRDTSLTSHIDFSYNTQYRLFIIHMNTSVNSALHLEWTNASILPEHNVWLSDCHINLYLIRQQEWTTLKLYLCIHMLSTTGWKRTVTWSQDSNVEFRLNHWTRTFCQTALYHFTRRMRRANKIWRGYEESDVEVIHVTSTVHNRDLWSAQTVFIELKPSTAPMT